MKNEGSDGRAVLPGGAIRSLIGAALSFAALAGPVAEAQEHPNRRNTASEEVRGFPQGLLGAATNARGNRGGAGLRTSTPGSHGGHLESSRGAGMVLSEVKISDTQGGFGGVLGVDDWFGRSVAFLGDLDGDGIVDLAVNAPGDDDGGLDRGAIWILFLETDGTVKSEQKISQTAGGFGGVLGDWSRLGETLAGIGDLDGDGVPDLAAGACADNTLWVLFLNSDGTVKAQQAIAPGVGGFVGNGNVLGLGIGVAPLGDLDGDGITDLAAGAFASYWGEGALWILFMRSDGTVKAEQEISNHAGGFGGHLQMYDLFGSSVCSLGDLDGDGVVDLAVGAGVMEIDPYYGSGSVWILFMNTNGTVKAEQEITDGVGGFGGTLVTWDHFGASVSVMGDIDYDGVVDLAVGSPGDDDGSVGDFDYGATWLLFLSTDGTVKHEQKISASEGSFDGVLDYGDGLGHGMVSIGDLDGDGRGDLAVGAPYDDDGGDGNGAVWILFLDGCPYAGARSRNPEVGGFTNPDVYAVTTLPVLGATFTASITTTGKTGSFLAGYTTPLTAAANWGNLLVNIADADGELLGLPSGVGDPTILSLPVPPDPALAGFTFSTQAARFGGGLDLTNAQDLVLGY